MSDKNNIFKNWKAPFLWTMLYVFILWVVLHILFGFEIFSAHDWIRVSHAHLTGLSGLTFSLILLTAIPLYIATTIVVSRTQKMLFNIPIPKFITVIWEKLNQPSQQTEDKPQEKNESVSQTNQPDTLIKNIPAEMRGAFLRARNHPNRIQTPICNVCSVTPNIYPQDNNNPAPTVPDTNLPLPPDFDFDDDTSPTPPTELTTPKFQDINLFADEPDTKNDSENTTQETNKLTEYLDKTKTKYSTLPNGIIITPNAAVAIHNDEDFWIMDDPTWFAAGKTRESIIPELLKTAKEHNIQPVFYLCATNIMNLDEKRTEWESAGIRVITDITEL